MAELSFDGGEQPPEPGQERPVEDMVDAPVVPAADEDAPEPEWKLRTMERCLSAVFLVMHWTLGRGGPEDAFLPEPAERREMAEPLCGVLNRWRITRAAARFGDVFAASTAVGGFVQVELRRTADYRAGAPTRERERVDGDVLQVAQVVAAQPVDHSDPSARSPHDTGPVRRWRPPAFEPEPS